MSKKILFISPLFPSSKKDDTIVPFIYQFAQQFSKQYSDIEVHVLAINYPFEKRNYSIDNLTIYTVGGGFKKGIFSILRFWKTFSIAFSLCKRNKYVGILSFWYGSSAIIGKLMRRMFNCKHKTWLQGQDVKSKNKFLKLFPSKGENLIVTGKNHQDLLSKNHHIITPHIANVAINELDFPKLKTGQRTIDVIGVGNLGPIKNYSKFIDIIVQVKKNKPDLHVVICGDGEERIALERKIKQLSLTDTVRLLGYIPNNKVKDLLNDSVVFLHTSVFEGNPMAIQEALYSGCKVVSTFDVRINHKSLKNFYHHSEIDAISKKIGALLLNTSDKYERIHQNKMEDTCKVIYQLYF